MCPFEEKLMFKIRYSIDYSVKSGHDPRTQGAFDAFESFNWTEWLIRRVVFEQTHYLRFKKSLLVGLIRKNNGLISH